VKTLSYFRHPALIFWLLVCVALGAVMVGAVYTGNHGSTSAIRREPVAQSSVVFSLRIQLSTLPSAAHGSSTTIAAWSDKTATLANQASANYRNTGGEAQDGINVEYLRLAADSQALKSAAVSNPAGVGAAAAQVLADGDVMIALLGGIGATGANNPGLP
jgi:hypothetical protein